MDSFVWLNRGVIILGMTTMLAVWSYRRGAAPEKFATAILLGMVVADRFNHFVFSGGKSVWATSDYLTIEAGHLVIDSAALIAFASIAVLGNRIYPAIMAGLQLCALLSHFSQITKMDFHPLAYAFLERSPFYLQMIVLACGIALHVRRSKKFGPYRSWRRTTNQ